MKIFIIIFLLLLQLGGTGGCKFSPFNEPSVSTQPPSPRTRRVAHSAHNVNNRELNLQTSPLSLPTDKLSLRDALSAALVHHPLLSTHEYNIRIAEANAIQAGRWPNPELEIEFENFAGSGELSGTDGLETTISLSQTLTLGNDTEYRQRLAKLHTDISGWDYEITRIAVLTTTTQRFIQVLANQRQLALAKESLALAEHVYDSINRRVQAGDASAVELLRAKVPVTTARLELQNAIRSLNTARHQLATTWAEASPKFTVALGNLDTIHPIPSSSELNIKIEQNPQISRWAVQIRARQAEELLAQAQTIPDLTTTLGYRYFNDIDEDALVAGITIPLPIFDQGDKSILAARLNTSAGHYEQQADRQRIQTQLADAHADLSSAYHNAVTLRDEALPPATEAYDAVSKAFDHGDVGVLDVLEARRTLMNIRKEYLDALFSYHYTMAAIEGLTGQSMSRTNTNKPRPSSSSTSPTTRDIN